MALKIRLGARLFPKAFVLNKKNIIVTFEIENLVLKKGLI
jgi:hypothetical protein